MLEISHELSSPEGDIQLHIEVTDGDNVILDRVGDSLVGNFVDILRSFMSGEAYSGAYQRNTVDGSNEYNDPAINERISRYRYAVTDRYEPTQTLSKSTVAYTPVTNEFEVVEGDGYSYSRAFLGDDPFTSIVDNVFTAYVSGHPEYDGLFRFVRHTASNLPDAPLNDWWIVYPITEDVNGNGLDDVWGTVSPDATSVYPVTRSYIPADDQYNAVTVAAGGDGGTTSPKIGVTRVQNDFQIVRFDDRQVLTKWVPVAETLSEPQLRVGTGTTAPNVADYNIESEALGLTYGVPVIDAPSIGSGASFIKISQTVTNTTDDPISLTEIGLYALVRTINNSDYYNKYYALIGRDLIGTAAGDSAITIAADASLTFSYKFITSATTAGGVLIQFNECIYRQFKQASRETKDVFNENITFAQSAGQLLTASPGGRNRHGSPTSVQGQFFGPQLGFSAKDVSNTDFRLQYEGGETKPGGGVAGAAEDARIFHGTAAHQLFIYPPVVTELDFDVAGNEASFECVCVFENLSGASITVNETGLYFGKLEAQLMQASHCLARHVLAVPVTIPNGDILKVTYTLTFVV